MEHDPTSEIPDPPAAATRSVRRINAIKRLMEQRYTLEQIQEQFLAFKSAMDNLEDAVEEVLGLFEQKLDGAARPVSELGQMKLVQELFEDNERSSAEIPVWIPSADPTQFLTAGVALDEGGSGSLTLGPMAFDAEFDPSGSMLKGSMQAGVAQIEVDRVWADGTPP